MVGVETAVQHSILHVPNFFRLSESDDSDYDSDEEWETNRRRKRNITNLLSQPLRNPHIKVTILLNSRSVKVRDKVRDSRQAKAVQPNSPGGHSMYLYHLKIPTCRVCSDPPSSTTCICFVTSVYLVVVVLTSCFTSNVATDSWF